MMQRELSIVGSKLRVIVIHSTNNMKEEVKNTLYDLRMNDCDVKEVREESDRTIIKYYLDDELYNLERM